MGGMTYEEFYEYDTKLEDSPKGSFYEETKYFEPTELVERINLDIVEAMKTNKINSFYYKLFVNPHEELEPYTFYLGLDLEEDRQGKEIVNFILEDICAKYDSSPSFLSKEFSHRFSVQYNFYGKKINPSEMRDFDFK